MLSDEGDISASLGGNGDLYGLEGLAVEGLRCRPYVTDFLRSKFGLGGSGAAKIVMTVIYDSMSGGKESKMTYINRVDFTLQRDATKLIPLLYTSTVMSASETIKIDYGL